MSLPPHQTWRKRIKCLALYVSKWMGLLRLARHLTRNGLRVLCYHGFAIGDEGRFRPGLFMTAETFRQRLEYLSRSGFNVMELGEAVRQLGGGSLPPNAAVLTFDDGFYSIYRCAVPQLRAHSMPATIYVTTYYCVHQNPVFRLAVQYLFALTTHDRIDLEGIGGGLSGQAACCSDGQRHHLAWRIIEFGETQGSESQRCIIVQQLAERLGLSYGRLMQTRGLHIMSGEEVRELAASGFDIQLHTHRHRFPTDETQARRELEDNRAVLEPLVGGKPLIHFCYPSGLWSKEHFAWLKDAGIASATTCDVGLNNPTTPRLALRRFLDSEYVSQVEFEAEMCGYLEILRRVRDWLRGRL